MTKKITYNQKNIDTIQKKEKEKKKILWGLPLGKGAPCMSQLPSSLPNKNPAVFNPLLFFFFPCRVVLEGCVRAEPVELDLHRQVIERMNAKSTSKLTGNFVL